MVFITLSEIIGIIAVTLIIGFIISGYIHRPRTAVEMLYQKPGLFNWEDLKFAMLISGPAVILHELGHKFAGMAFGLPAVFKAFWGGLGLGIVLRLIHSPFLVLAPAYVAFPTSSATPLQMSVIAFAGPFINLVLWLGSAAYLKYNKKKLSRMKLIALMLTKRINMILFIFNMIPFPPLDGYHIFSNLYQLIA